MPNETRYVIKDDVGLYCTEICRDGLLQTLHHDLNKARIFTMAEVASWLIKRSTNGATTPVSILPVKPVRKWELVND